jgi:hypothetical protein
MFRGEVQDLQWDGKPAIIHNGLRQTHRKSRRQLKHASHMGMILDTTSYFIPPRGVHHLNIVDRSGYDMSIAMGHTRAWYRKNIREFRRLFPALKVAMIHVTATAELDTIFSRVELRAKETGRSIPKELTCCRQSTNGAQPDWHSARRLE